MSFINSTELIIQGSFGVSTTIFAFVVFLQQIQNQSIFKIAPIFEPLFGEFLKNVNSCFRILLESP